MGAVKRCSGIQGIRNAVFLMLAITGSRSRGNNWPLQKSSSDVFKGADPKALFVAPQSLPCRD